MKPATFFVIESVSLVPSWVDSPAFSVQQALWKYANGDAHFRPNGKPVMPYSGILYHKGCFSNSPSNCTAACQQPDQVWSNPFTLHNCMVLASLSRESLQNMTISNASINVAQDFGMDPQSLAFPVLARVSIEVFTIALNNTVT